ncbi:MAG TPA: MarR family transcriptional regulator [Pseudolabrys sp.]|nr:MarR family transcriptional regulator [Pseudolabrys sp.]
MAAESEDKQERRAADPHDTSGALADLEEALAFLVRGLEAVQRRRSYPLERAHYLLVGLIEREGPQTIGAVARRLLLDDSTVTRQVAAMVRHGLIRKAPRPGDARSIVLEVTAKGRDDAEAMRAARLKRLARLFRDWTEEERRQGAKVLSRLNASLIDVLKESQR